MLVGKEELVRLIAGLFKSRMVVPGDPAEYEGYLRLMGEGFEF